MARNKSPQSVDSTVLARFRRSGRGTVFTPGDFLDLGNRRSIDQALFRLHRAGKIRRIARGMYYQPKTHPLLGELLPTIEAIAKALAGRDRIRLQPADAYATNLLGLSEQVPARVVFLTEGPGRSVKVGATTIQLRHTTPRNMAASGRLSGLVIQAFRHLGKEHITPERLAHLRRTIPQAERRKLIRDLPLAPIWMHPHFRTLAAP